MTTQRPEVGQIAEYRNPMRERVQRRLRGEIMAVHADGTVTVPWGGTAGARVTPLRWWDADERPQEACWNCGGRELNLAGEHGLVCATCCEPQSEV